MRYKSVYRPVIVMCVLLICTTITGVFASWMYNDGPPTPVEQPLSISMNQFRYGLLYVTRVDITGGNYNYASTSHVSDLNIEVSVDLENNKSSSVTMEVTFYNNADVSFYYDKTETVSANNENIIYTVEGIAQKDEVKPGTYKKLQLTFKYNGSDVSANTLLSELHFNFVIDKDSIGGVVAQTAVERFGDILNNVVAEDSYQTLDTAMDNRSGWNKESAVTYIGNVYGSSSTDSKVIESLFGEEFMSMDLDGDGDNEPITIMIKRENLDNNTATGVSYTYTSWGRNYTVNGVEMTLYITSDNLENVSSGKSITVYAASFTKLKDADQWTMLVPLTKGYADANNYNGYGSANSFNTDTWLSEEGRSIKELAVS